MLPQEEEMIHMTTNGRINACILGYHLVCSETQIQQSTAICAKIGTLIFILFFFIFALESRCVNFSSISSELM